MLSAGRDNRQFVWNAHTGAEVAKLNGHHSRVEAVAISPDGKRVATAGQDSLIRLWDPMTWKPILLPRGPRDSVWRLEVARDGKHAAASSGDGVHVWELDTGREILTIDRNGRGRWPARAASCQSDGGLTVYETRTGHVLAQFHGHREGLMAIAMTPDGNRVLTGGGDHQVLVWDVSDKKLAGAVRRLSADERLKTWDTLGTQPGKQAIKTMAALAADPDTIALFASNIRPVAVVDPAILDRIFRDLDSSNFVARAKADRELNGLGAGALAGVRQRMTKAKTPEVNQRAALFLNRHEGVDLRGADYVRLARAFEVLAAMNTPAARKLVQTVADGAGDVWQTTLAQRTLQSMLTRPARQQ